MLVSGLLNTTEYDIAAIPLARRMTNFTDYPNNAIRLKELQKSFRKHCMQYEDLFEDFKILPFNQSGSLLLIVLGLIGHYMDMEKR